jgi:orotidine-5'-phosphate decarboxylase
MNLPELFVAVDYTKKEDVHELIQKLEPVKGDFGYKINLDLLLLENGIGVVDEFIAYGRPIFVDLKMWNGRRTMSAIVDKLASTGVALTNIYAHAGADFLQGAVDAVDGRDLKILGLTVLTHYTEADTQRLYKRDFRSAARMLAEIAEDGNCYGIVVPATVLDVVSDLDLTNLTPGIRPIWYENRKDNWQSQTVTPAIAKENGSDFLVCGGPIRKAQDPAEALRKTLVELK